MTPALSLLLAATMAWAGVRREIEPASVDPSAGVCSMAEGTESHENACTETPGTDASKTQEGRRQRIVSQVHFRGPLEPSVVRAARTLLDLPLGSEVVLDVDGTPYGFRLEPHYHPPGFEGGPIGWHKGVTLYHVVERNAE